MQSEHIVCPHMPCEPQLAKLPSFPKITRSREGLLPIMPNLCGSRLDRGLSHSLPRLIEKSTFVQGANLGAIAPAHVSLWS